MAFKSLKEMPRGAQMETKKAFCFDTDCVALRVTLADAWASLRSKQRASTSQSILAEGILNLAAQGERDPKRPRAAALALAA